MDFKEIKKLNGIRSNLTSTNKCKLSSVQLQVLVNNFYLFHKQMTLKDVINNQSIN